MADKLRDQQLLEAMQARYLGIGSADTLTAEWHKNVARDTINSTVGHPAMLTYISIGSGQCRERTRLALLERMIKPTVKLAPKVGDHCCRLLLSVFGPLLI
jgi:splicing factor 3B subunit 5